MRSLFLLCGISLLWGSGWIVVPLLAQTAAPFAASGLTFAAAAVVLGAASLAGRFPAHRKADARVPLRASLLLALTMLACPLALLLIAGRHGVSGWVPLLYACLPLFTGFAAWSPAMVLAPGAVLVLLNGIVPFSVTQTLWALPVLAAVATQAFALRYAARGLRRASLRALLRSVALQCVLAAALLAAGSLFFDPSPRLAPQWNAFSMGALLLLAVATTALAYAGLYWLLARSVLAPRQVAVTQWLQLLVAVGESAWFAHTWPSWPMLAAAAILAGCAWSVLLSSLRAEDAIAFRDTPAP